MVAGLSILKVHGRKWLGKVFPPETFHLNSHRPAALVKLYSGDAPDEQGLR
jgi:hypothetical protein